MIERALIHYCSINGTLLSFIIPFFDFLLLYIYISFRSDLGIKDPRSVMLEEDLYKRVIRLALSNNKGLSQVRL